MKTYSIIKINPITKDKTPFAKGLFCGQISSLIGIHNGKVAMYADKGSLYKKEFIIAIDGEKEEDSWKSEFTEKWDRMLKAADVMKHGGKIMMVVINGKTVRYVRK